MATFRDLLPLTRPGVPGAPDFVLLDALRRSAQLFCRKSRIWKGQADDIVLEPSVDEYDVEGPPGAGVEQVLWAKRSGSPLNVSSEEAIFAQTSDTPGSPSAVALKYLSQTVRVWPNPSAGSGTLSLFCVFSPSRQAQELPDTLVDEWQVAIVAGAKGELLGTPGQPWTNPGAADAQWACFYDKVSDARKKASSGNGAELRVTPRRFI